MKSHQLVEREREQYKLLISYKSGVHHVKKSQCLFCGSKQDLRLLIPKLIAEYGKSKEVQRRTISVCKLCLTDADLDNKKCNLQVLDQHTKYT